MTAERVPIDSLRTYHRNPRQGSIPAIRGSLIVNGQYRPIVVNRGTHTGRPAEVLAGNHTLLAHRDLVANPPAGGAEPPAVAAERWAHIDVWWVDVDDDQAARIVAADNRTSDLATNDDRLLAELLGDLPDLDGTGYDPGDLTDLLARLDGPPAGPANDPWDEWKGMPEYESEDQTAWQTIKVHFRSAADRDAFAQLVGQKISDKTRFIWHPEAEWDRVGGLAYVSDEE